MRVRSKMIILGVAVIAAVISMSALAPVATAAPASTALGKAATIDASSPSGALDPATFAGPMVVAVPSGHEVVVNVKVGEAPKVAAEIQAADKVGAAQALGTVVAPMAGCGESVRSVVGPRTWWTSVHGCAVFGYPGYNRIYQWQNVSDVSLCTTDRGWNSSQVGTWYSTGCTGGNYSVPWGNVLAYAQMQGFSLTGVTGAAVSC